MNINKIFCLLLSPLSFICTYNEENFQFVKIYKTQNFHPTHPFLHTLHVVSGNICSFFIFYTDKI